LRSLNFEKFAKQADIELLDDVVIEEEDLDSLDAAIQAGVFDQAFHDEPVQLREEEEEEEASHQLPTAMAPPPRAAQTSQGIPWRFRSSQLTDRDAEGETQEDFDWDKF
jgi:hypothetical protein